VFGLSFHHCHRLPSCCYEGRADLIKFEGKAEMKIFKVDSTDTVLFPTRSQDGASSLLFMFGPYEFFKTCDRAEMATRPPVCTASPQQDDLLANLDTITNTQSGNAVIIQYDTTTSQSTQSFAGFSIACI
jgi:hypothetical protein